MMLSTAPFGRMTVGVEIFFCTFTLPKKKTFEFDRRFTGLQRKERELLWSWIDPKKSWEESSNSEEEPLSAYTEQYGVPG